MRKLDRRTLMAAGTTLAAGGLLGSTATAQEGDDGEGGAEGGGSGNGDFGRPDGVAWRYDGSYRIDTTVATGGRVHTQENGSISTLDAEDGSLEWETDDIGASGAPVVEGDAVYTAGESIRAFDAETGEERWESEVGGNGIAVAHGTVYTSAEGTLYALDADDGSIRWERDSFEVSWELGEDEFEKTGEEVTLGDADEEGVYASSPLPDSGNSGIAAFDPETGETEWSLSHFMDIETLTAGSGHVAVWSGGDQIAYLYPMGAQERVVSDLAEDILITDGIFFTNGPYEFTAYDLSDGVEQTWQYEGDAIFPYSVPVVVGDTVVTAHATPKVGGEGTDERIVAYDLSTGEERWQYAFDGSEWSHGGFTWVAADEDTVYVSRNDELLALRSGLDDRDGSEDDESGDSEDEPGEEPEDEDPADEDSGNEEPAGDEPEGDGDGGGDEPEDGQDEDPSLELSVSAPDSIARGESASVDIRVWNHGEDAADVTITLEAGDVSESVTV
ncbi:PQQ-binding-like beta-propeller repeat protein [Saliphagus sp. LR7]|uniref:outer membrane protein assembly factor BamB family protein n=1 Tax=Saliphagus sp. LR7 TaxID=2282654 RepID=UPI000DF75B5A|nr:PQQ-binding-like beta-propeller repeat protein [Saliphagus sp. LR7]